MTRWEYTGHWVSAGCRENVIDILDRYGNAGWELVCVNSEWSHDGRNEDGYVYYFKRPK